jgi:SAM-dependent methyltransferase
MPMSTVTALRLVCPRCRADVAEEPAAHRCTGCASSYPTVAGIPDFRVAADPWISIEDDRAKALRLHGETAGLDFLDTVRAYWDMTPGTPRERAETFIAHAARAERRSREWLAAMPGKARGGAWLDIGCGTADLAAAAPAGVSVTGVDIALRWLVVARKRPGLGPLHRLICADAAHLPFADATFGRVLGLGLLEHCAAAEAVLEEAARVLEAGGRACFRTTNRYTLLREPHVGVWGVGWLPRRWADAYVRHTSGQRYLHHRPLSARELRRGLTGAGFRDSVVRAALPLPSEQARLARTGRFAARIYGRLASAPATGAGFALIAPILEAAATKP